MQSIHVRTKINGQAAEFLCEPRQSLLEVLRDVLRLTGTKEGCNDGNCGACTVEMDGRIVPGLPRARRGGRGRGHRYDRGDRRGQRVARDPECLPSRAQPCSAAFARRASSSPPRRFWTATRTRARKRSVSGWQTIFAAAQATTRSCARCRRQPRRCSRRPRHEHVHTGTQEHIGCSGRQVRQWSAAPRQLRVQHGARHADIRRGRHQAGAPRWRGQGDRPGSLRRPTSRSPARCTALSCAARTRTRGSAPSTLPRRSRWTACTRSSPPTTCPRRKTS